jgi:serine/threonine-protein kinase
MSEKRTEVNSPPAAGEENASPPGYLPHICPTCGEPGEIATADLFTAPTAMDGEMPPPPRPLPDVVAQVAAGLLVAPERAGPAGLPVVAGYEILGPLGRGGTGLVYRARQLKESRMVALKLIKGGAQAEPRDLARFRTEAEAVAHLQHPHIVPIYEVGEHENWAYFALEFVSGGSLARHLAGRPQPAGASAQLVEVLARTMAYTHERGILHRDLKPANVLLTADGIPKISDFGLAKHLETEPETAAPRNQTQTGELLGTPSYMAPEQTWGRPGEVGTAADVYALGAILYECLTGRPPFQAATPLDTLLQVRSEEPVPPRRLVPSIPRDLDTICLKCLQKEPRQRYPSANALAEDLGRFLGGAPVQARPAGIWERTIRWARRRKAVAALLSVTGIAVLSLLALGVWHYGELRRYNAELSMERKIADEQRELAQRKAVEVQQEKKKAEKQWQRAEAHFQSALAAVEKMLARVSEEHLADEPRMELVRRRLLQDALRFYQRFLQEKGNDPEVRWQTASTYLRIGDIQKRLGQHPAAEQAYRAAIPLFQGLAAEFPKLPDYRHALAGCYTNLGTLLVQTPRQKEAVRLFRRALDIQQVLVKEIPRVADYRSALAGTQHNLATLLLEAGQLGQAEKALSVALDQRQRLAERYPRNADYRQDLARTWSNLGHLLTMSRRPGKAEEACRQALKLQQKLVEDYPRVPAYRQELAGSHNWLGVVLDGAMRFEEAENEYTQALALQERLVEDFPRVPAYRQEVARTHHNLALLRERMKQPGEAEQAYLRAVDIFQPLVDEFPTVPQQHHELATILAHLGEFLFRQGRWAEARQTIERAIQYQQAALKLIPRHPAYVRSLGRHCRLLVETLLRLGDHAGLAQTAAKLAGYFPPSAGLSLYTAGLLARCVPLAEKDPTLAREEREAQALAYGNQAMVLLLQGLHYMPRPTGKWVKTNPHYASLRRRADFQQVVRELEESAQSKDK